VVIESIIFAKRFGDRLLIDDLSFKLPPGGIVGILGPTAPVNRRSLNDHRKRKT